MTYQPLFKGLIFDENDRPVGVTMVGEEPCYVVDLPEPRSLAMSPVTWWMMLDSYVTSHLNL